jgi:PAS domain S-box-containing protein
LKKERPTHYTTIFNALPGASVLVNTNAPEFTVVAATDEFIDFGATSRVEMTGKSIFTYFPDNPAAPNVSTHIRDSLYKCLMTKERSELKSQRYDLKNADGTFTEMYWRVSHSPILSEDGEVEYIIHTATDITEETLSRRKDQQISALEPAHNLFMQSAMAIHIFMGPEKVVTLANEPTLKLWNRDYSVIGKPLLEILPEMAAQPYPAIIDRVRETGIPYHAHEAEAEFLRDGRNVVGYFNFVMQPYYDNETDKPVGVIVMVNEITDIITGRKALQEKERTIEMAAEIGDMGTFNVDLQSGMISYSPQVMDWFGIEKSNITLPEFLAKVYPEDRHLVKEVFGSPELQSPVKHDITFRVKQPGSDSLFYLRSIGQSQMTEGKLSVISGIIQDISARVKSQTEAEQVSQRLKSVVESAPFPIGVYTGEEMRIDLANQTMLDTWGKGNEVVGKLYSDILPELDNQEVFGQLHHVFTTGEAFHARNKRIDLVVDGFLKTYYFNYSFTPLFNAEGNVYGVMNTAADVTDLNLVMQKAEKSEQNFRNMLLQAPVAMCLLTGPEHEVTIVNDKMLQIWGRKESEVMYKPVFTALPDVASQGFESLMQRVYYDGVTISASETPVTILRDGKSDIVYQNFVYQPYIGADGAIDGIVAISIDVTPQVMARQKIEEVVAERTYELEVANTNLQRSNAALEQFAYVASHDLQEPLRKISMFTERLRDSKTKMSEQDVHFMDRIRNSTSRMTTLIRDILNYSQLSRAADVFEDTSLKEIIDEASIDFDVILQERGGSIQVGEMPVISAIPLQMTQLFHNLISNSVKYSRTDIAPRITVNSREATEEDLKEFGIERSGKHFIRIDFSDNGIGFPQEYAEKIFSIFQRLHGKLQYEGTGIGLAMCRKITENHNGYITAYSKEGEGATFVIILPVSHE